MEINQNDFYRSNKLNEKFGWRLIYVLIRFILQDGTTSWRDQNHPVFVGTVEKLENLQDMSLPYSWKRSIVLGHISKLILNYLWENILSRKMYPEN